MATTNANQRKRDERVALHSFAPMLHGETVADAQRVLGDYFDLALRTGALYVVDGRVVSEHA